eukprot:Sspe_Gene.36656::Locus_17710_Transcript_8_8_Confidence_0.357_Length_3965::g.36656::m.36656
MPDGDWVLVSSSETPPVALPLQLTKETVAPPHPQDVQGSAFFTFRGQQLTILTLEADRNAYSEVHASIKDVGATRDAVITCATTGSVSSNGSAMSSMRVVVVGWRTADGCGGGIAALTLTGKWITDGKPLMTPFAPLGFVVPPPRHVGHTLLVTGASSATPVGVSLSHSQQGVKLTAVAYTTTSELDDSCRNSTCIAATWVPHPVSSIYPRPPHETIALATNTGELLVWALPDGGAATAHLLSVITLVPPAGVMQDHAVARSLAVSAALHGLWVDLGSVIALLPLTPSLTASPRKAEDMDTDGELTVTHKCEYATDASVTIPSGHVAWVSGDTATAVDFVMVTDGDGSLVQTTAFEASRKGTIVRRAVTAENSPSKVMGLLPSSRSFSMRKCSLALVTQSSVSLMEVIPRRCQILRSLRALGQSMFDTAKDKAMQLISEFDGRPSPEGPLPLTDLFDFTWRNRMTGYLHQWAAAIMNSAKIGSEEVGSLRVLLGWLVAKIAEVDEDVKRCMNSMGAENWDKSLEGTKCGSMAWVSQLDLITYALISESESPGQELIAAAAQLEALKGSIEHLGILSSFARRGLLSRKIISDAAKALSDLRETRRAALLRLLDTVGASLDFSMQAMAGVESSPPENIPTVVSQLHRHISSPPKYWKERVAGLIADGEINEAPAPVLILDVLLAHTTLKPSPSPALLSHGVVNVPEIFCKISTPQLTVGAKVDLSIPVGAGWNSGVVTAIHPDGTFDISTADSCVHRYLQQSIAKPRGSPPPVSEQVQYLLQRSTFLYLLLTALPKSCHDIALQYAKSDAGMHTTWTKFIMCLWCIEHTADDEEGRAQLAQHPLFVPTVDELRDIVGDEEGQTALGALSAFVLDAITHATVTLWARGVVHGQSSGVFPYLRSALERIRKAPGLPVRPSEHANTYPSKGLGLMAAIHIHALVQDGLSGLAMDITRSLQAPAGVAFILHVALDCRRGVDQIVQYPVSHQEEDVLVAYIKHLETQQKDAGVVPGGPNVQKADMMPLLIALLQARHRFVEALAVCCSESMQGNHTDLLAPVTQKLEAVLPPVQVELVEKTIAAASSPFKASTFACADEDSMSISDVATPARPSSAIGRPAFTPVTPSSAGRAQLIPGSPLVSPIALPIYNAVEQMSVPQRMHSPAARKDYTPTPQSQKLQRVGRADAEDFSPSPAVGNVCQVRLASTSSRPNMPCGRTRPCYIHDRREGRLK